MVGEDDDDGKKDDEEISPLVVREDRRKSVHGGVEDDCREEVGAGMVVEPGEDDGQRNHENDAEEQVIYQVVAKRAMEVERGVPEGPGEPNEKAGEERGKALLKAWEKEPAPAGFFEGGGEKEGIQKCDATIGSRKPNGVVMLRPRQRDVEEMRDGCGNEQNRGPEEKRDGLPAPIAGMNERVQKFADAGIAREGAGKNPRGNRRQKTYAQIIRNGNRGVDATESVVGDVDGPSEEPEQRER